MRNHLPLSEIILSIFDAQEYGRQMLNPKTEISTLLCFQSLAPGSLIDGILDQEARFVSCSL